MILQDKGDDVDLNIEEIRSLNDEEIREQLDSAYEALFSCRLHLAARQLTNHREIPMIKKRIARIKTVVRERDINKAGSGV